MAGYAKGTKATRATSQAEILRTLERFGVENKAVSNVSGWHPETGKRVDVWRLQFEYDDRQIRFDMDAADGEPQEVRERYRALALHVKSQCVAVDNGFMLAEHAFLMDSLIPVNVNGVTEVKPVREVISPYLRAALGGTPLPPLLPHVTEG